MAGHAPFFFYFFFKLRRAHRRGRNQHKIRPQIRATIRGRCRAVNGRATRQKSRDTVVHRRLQPCKNIKRRKTKNVENGHHFAA